MNTEPNARMAPIRPELVASKLAAIRNYEYPQLLEQITERPRLVELMWFIQAMSLRPGGLAKFSEELIAAFPERLGTPTMRAIGGRSYTHEEKAIVWAELPSHCRPFVKQEHNVAFETIFSNLTRQELADLEGRDRAEFKAAMKEFSRELFLSRCQEAALEVLPSLLSALCTEKGCGFDCERSDDALLAAEWSTPAQGSSRAAVNRTSFSRI